MLRAAADLVQRNASSLLLTSSFGLQQGVDYARLDARKIGLKDKFFVR